MREQVPSLRIGLIDNACHSLQRGYEMWREGRQKQDALRLKEAIIWIHHGIELSLKQLLVQTNEYLVFADVDEAVRKLAHLRRQPGTENATVLDLFEHGRGAYTVGFRRLVDRVAMMLAVEELAQGAPLREKIEELANYRNRIVHFSTGVQVDEVTRLLAELMEPFLALVEREVEDEDFVQECLPRVRASAESVTSVFRVRQSQIKDRIESLLRKFDGQQVSGALLGVEGSIVLPQFTEVVREAVVGPRLTLPGFEELVAQKVDGLSLERSFRADILARGSGEEWTVEIRLANPNLDQLMRLMQRDRRRKYSRLWLVVMGSDRIIHRATMRNCGILSSSESDIKELERII